MQIIPTILEKNIGEVEARIKLIGDTSKWIQVDVIDGKFSFGKSFELELLTKMELAQTCLWDIHLMVDNPEKWIEKCMFVQANRISGQVERMADREKFVKLVKDTGMEAGLAFDIETEVENIPEETDLILLMGRKAGFGEYDLDGRVFRRIEQAKRTGKMVAVDGGVNIENIKKLEEAGVNMVYSGSNYFDLINAN